MLDIFFKLKTKISAKRARKPCSVFKELDARDGSERGVKFMVLDSLLIGD